MVQINQKRFMGAIRLYTQTALAAEIGISRPALAKKLKSLDRLRFSDFNRICKILGEKASEFLIIDGAETIETPTGVTDQASKPVPLDSDGDEISIPEASDSSDSVTPNPDQLDFTQHEDDDDDDDDYYGGGRKVSQDEIVEQGGYYNEDGDWAYESYSEEEKKVLGDWIENSYREVWTLKEKFFEGTDLVALLTDEQFRMVRSLSSFLKDLILEIGYHERSH